MVDCLWEFFFPQSSCGVGSYFSLRLRNQKSRTPMTVRAIKMTKTAMMMMLRTLVVEGVASAEIIGEARHSALKRLFATKLSMQMEKLYVLDASTLCPLISSRENRFSTCTSHQPRRLVSVWHAADSIIKTIGNVNSLGFLGSSIDVSHEDEWRELKDAVADACQAHLGGMRHRHWDWVTGEIIALAQQARRTRIQSAPNHLDLSRQTMGALRRDHSAYWKASAEETERAAACGDTRKLYQTLKSVCRRPAEVGEV